MNGENVFSNLKWYHNSITFCSGWQTIVEKDIPLVELSHGQSLWGTTHNVFPAQTLTYSSNTKPWCTGDHDSESNCRHSSSAEDSTGKIILDSGVKKNKTKGKQTKKKNYEKSDGWWEPTHFSGHARCHLFSVKWGKGRGNGGSVEKLESLKINHVCVHTH